MQRITALERREDFINEESKQQILSREVTVTRAGEIKVKRLWIAVKGNRALQAIDQEDKQGESTCQKWGNQEQMQFWRAAEFVQTKGELNPRIVQEDLHRKGGNDKAFERGDQSIERKQRYFARTKLHRDKQPSFAKELRSVQQIVQKLRLPLAVFKESPKVNPRHMII